MENKVLLQASEVVICGLQISKSLCRSCGRIGYIGESYRNWFGNRYMRLEYG